MRYLDEYGLRRRANESEIIFCYRAMQHLAKKYVYDAGPDCRDLGGRGLGEGSRLPGTDCGGHSRILVGIARANAIPSRLLTGQWAIATADENTFKGAGLTSVDKGQQLHVRVEFYAQGVGWVPVEATEKDEPFRLFGNDPDNPFCTKSLNELSLKFTYARNSTYTFCGAVQTFVVSSLNAKMPASATFLKWQVESSVL